MKIKSLSVSEANQYIKRILISDPILSHIYIKGEISNYKLHTSGHMYFSLKDKDSKINCVMFKTNCEELQFMPEEGMNVICKGYISIYERDGKYQLYVTSIEPAGIGALYLAYQQLKNKLELEGLFNIENKKQLPAFPKKIGIITSPTGAAIRDVISIISRRFPNVELNIFPVVVQGEKAAQSIVDAIQLCNNIEGLDVIIVGRGGGSIEELWAFNEEIVARAIYASNVTIISAVGHETDFTIADFVADLRAPTPSAAAELVVPNIMDINEYLNSNKLRLAYAIKIKIEQYKQQLELIKNNHSFKFPLDKVHDYQQYIDDLLKDLTESLISKNKLSRNHIEHLGERLNSLSPLSIFSRGYSILKDDNGQIIKSIDQVENGNILNVDLMDGQVVCKAIKCIKEEKAFVKNEI